MFEWKITILNQDPKQTPEEEISRDIIQIMNIYVAKINGMRKYKNKLNKLLLQ